MKNKNIKVLLVTPPLPGGFGYKETLERIEAPLGLLYIAALLEKEKIDVSVLDAFVLKLSDCETLKEIKERNADIIGITATSDTMDRAVDLAKSIKGAGINSLLVLGGPHVTALPVKTLKDYPWFDLGVVGEGEYTFLELVKSYQDKKPFKDIKGIVYRDKESGAIILNDKREPIKNLDELPLPARHLVDVSRYRTAPTEYNRHPCFSIITSRGCPYNCIFCSNLFGKAVRTHSPEYVIKEIEELVNVYGAKCLRIVDDLFTFDKKRIIKICDLLIAKKIDVTWSCEARADYIDEELLKKMRRAGCWAVGFGVEAGNSRVLESIHKNVSLEKIEHAVKLTKKCKIAPRGFFIIGHPLDTKETIRETIDFAKKLPFDNIHVSVLTTYPGTALLKLSKITDDFDWAEERRKNEFFNLFVPEGMTLEYLNRMRDQAHKEFYLRPRYIIKKLFDIRDLADLRRYHEGGKILFQIIKSTFFSSDSSRK